MIKVYGKDNCPRCRVITNRLQNYGIEHEYHSAAYHTEHHTGWRDDNSAGILAYLTLKDGELPVVDWKGELMDCEMALDVADQHKEAEIIKHGERNGWYVDYDVLADVRASGFNCPCRTKPTPCPCPGHGTAISHSGACGCGLYRRVET